MRTVLVMLLVGALVAGCFGEGGITVAPPKGSGGGSAAPGTAPSKAPASKSAPSGNTLRLLGDDPPTIDPALVQDATSSEYIVEIFSGLFTLNDKLEVVPDIAESYDVSPDGLVYTFKLRKDVKFQDGRGVTAQDFKYSMERAADPRTESLVADTYLGDIVGVKDKLRGKAKEISGIKVVDDYTLQITIDSPKVYFLSKLTYPTAFVVDKNNVEKGGRRWTNQPNGTGPFKLKEWKRGESITLVRNDNFYGGAPKVDQVVYNIAIAGAGTGMTMYENGDIDMVGVGLADIDRVQDPASELNSQLVRAPSLSIGYVGLNALVPPFDDVKMRQAFAAAIDKQKIVDVVLKGTVQKADGIVPPGMPEYQNKNLKPIAFDPQRAKQLLAESRYADPSSYPPLTFYVSGEGGASPRTVTAIVEMIKQNLGIDIKIQQTEWATFLQDLSTDQKKYPMFSLGWVADYPDPQNFLDVLFHSNSLDNHTGYSNKEVDALLEQARTEKDQAKRMDLYYQAEQKIVGEAGWIPLDYGESYILVKPYLKNVRFSLGVSPWLRFVSIEGAR
ncbi:MAG: peptide ABC transporter substrate-binding protein [Chloroflexi bacterium]|nr:peptide ABC transporter substrate-binding protein [Chloroflexota bacterium]MCL5026942.1 peptide ABC transporter substrate-binding protein [Chloroflexota bacterium]